MIEDLRDSIENHCTTCNKLGSYYCSVCFFSSIDMGTINLGNKRTYRRAYHLLNQIRKKGFERNETFGTRLQITLKGR